MNVFALPSSRFPLPPPLPYLFATRIPHLNGAEISGANRRFDFREIARHNNYQIVRCQSAGGDFLHITWRHCCQSLAISRVEIERKAPDDKLLDATAQTLNRLHRVGEARDEIVEHSSQLRPWNGLAGDPLVLGHRLDHRGVRRARTHVGRDTERTAARPEIQTAERAVRVAVLLA